MTNIASKLQVNAKNAIVSAEKERVISGCDLPVAGCCKQFLQVSARADPGGGGPRGQDRGQEPPFQRTPKLHKEGHACAETPHFST